MEPEALQHQEVKGEHGDRHVVMLADPGASLEVVEPDAVLELLVVALHLPADLGPVDRVPQGGVLREIGEPELRRLGLLERQLDEQPLDRLTHLSPGVAVGRLDPKRGGATLQRPLGAFPPHHLKPGLRGKAHRDGQSLFLWQKVTLPRSPLPLVGQYLGNDRLSPYPHRQSPPRTGADAPAIRSETSSPRRTLHPR